MQAAELMGKSTYSLVQTPGERSSRLLSLERPHQVQTDGRRIPEHASQSRGATSPPRTEKGEHPGQKNGSGPRTWCPPTSSNNKNTTREALLQYSGPENSMTCIVRGVAKSRTRWRDFTFISIEKVELFASGA